MVLEVEALGIGGVARHLVHALAELEGLSLGEEADDDPLIARPPRRAAVVGSVDPRRGDGDQQSSRILRVHQDRVQAQTATARLPLRAVWVVPQPVDQ